MGLDVYLSYYTNYEQSKKNEADYEAYSENLWETVRSVEGDDLSEESKKKIWELLEAEAVKYDVDKYGCDLKYHTRIEENSKLYPEHYFKIGYFRSSYNGSGINSILRDLQIPDLYDIFSPEGEYEFRPNWHLALSTVQESITLLEKDKGYRVETVSANLFAPDDVPVSPAAALEIFHAQLKEKHGAHNWYSNKHGQFYLDKKGLTVHGMIPGKDMFQRPCSYVVYKQKDANKYYLEALAIVKETIEFVLAQKDPQNYYLRWSG